MSVPDGHRGEMKLTIRSTSAFLGSLWDWAILDGCFGTTRISPTDIDGVVERNGQLLILEAKGKEVCLTTGQDIMFRQVTRSGFVTVIVVRGEPQNPVDAAIYQDGVEDRQMHPCDIPRLRRMVTAWFERANRARPGVAMRGPIYAITKNPKIVLDTGKGIG